VAVYTNNAATTAALTRILSVQCTVLSVVGDSVSIQFQTHYSDASDTYDTLGVNALTGAGTARLLIITTGRSAGQEPYNNGWLNTPILLTGPYTRTYAGVPRQVLGFASTAWGGIQAYLDIATGLLTEFSSTPGSALGAPGERVVWTLQSTSLWGSSGVPEIVPRPVAALSEVGLPSLAGIVTGTHTESDNVFWDVSHWDYQLSVTSEVRATTDAKNKIIAATNGTCTARALNTCTIGSLGRLFGWDLISQVHGVTSFTATHAEHVHEADFGAFVFYVGQLTTYPLSALAQVDVNPEVKDGPVSSPWGILVLSAALLGASVVTARRRAM
jgi:hypothetical protein